MTQRHRHAVDEELIVLTERDTGDVVDRSLDVEIADRPVYSAGYADGVFAVLQAIDLQA